MSNGCYDEDLTQNRMFLALRSGFPEVFEEAVREGWLICVPSSPGLPPEQAAASDVLLRDHHFLMRHILVPNDNEGGGGGGQFRSLVDRRVVLSGKTLTVTSSLPDKDEEDDITVNVLFNETVYDEANKFSLVCLETPIRDPSYDGSAFTGLLIFEGYFITAFFPLVNKPGFS